MKRLTDGHGALTGHHGDEEDAHSTKRVLSEELGHVPSREMAVLLERESTINLGAMTEEKATSKRDRR